MDWKKVEKLLDKSCANALKDWHKGRGKDPARALEAITALEQKLNRLEKPDYDDEYTPPAYVVSYQLGRVFMAWQTLSKLREETSFGTSHGDSLRIVDFGAGTSVGRIGAALMVAEAIESGCSIDHVFVKEIDTSRRMLGMGTGVWRAFTQEVNRSFANTALALAVKAVKGGQTANWESVGGDDRDTWLTAFHVTYGSQDLHEIIKTLYHRVKPIAGVFSCNRENLDMMREVFHFSREEKCISGFYPPHKGRTDGKVRCATYYTMDRAILYGFRHKAQRQTWLPFLQVINCAILFGYNLSS